MDLSDDVRCRKRQCASCPFGPPSAKRIILSEERLAEIRAYLAQGMSHMCHSDSSNNTVCRGGRNFQLQVFCEIGIIPEPTDAALREAMRKAGVEPRNHL